MKQHFSFVALKYLKNNVFFLQEINGKREFGSHGSLEVMGRHHPAHLPSSAMLPGGPVITGAASHLQVMFLYFFGA